jgi:hypothetical protein
MNLQRDQQKGSIAYLQNCDICVSLNISAIDDIEFVEPFNNYYAIQPFEERP